MNLFSLALVGGFVILAGFIAWRISRRRRVEEDFVSLLQARSSSFEAKLRQIEAQSESRHDELAS